MAVLRVLHADDHPIVRQGCRAILEREGFEIVGEAADGRAAIELAQLHRPDAAVLDARMPGVSGLDAARTIADVSPATAIIILSMYIDDQSVVAALRAGIRAYVAKTEATAELAFAVRDAVAGRTYVSRTLRRRGVERFLSDGILPSDTLADKERDVVRLIAEGKTTAAIAEALHVTAKTAETYRTRVMRKLNVHDVAGLVRWAVRHGLIDAALAVWLLQ
jgi:DNA-binding NarL/FixJ family response regulator